MKKPNAIPPLPLDDPDRSGTAITRRRFVSRCAACMACGSASLSSGIRPWAAQPPSRRPKIRLVFCETPNDKPIWPNVGYRFDARRDRITALLASQCPDIEFRTASVMNDPAHAEAVLERDAEVDGYLVCIQGLGWKNDIVKLCATGKPTLLADNLYGGSGLFLREIAKIMGAGHPVDWVSSGNDSDLVASARRFAGLAQGKSGAEIAAAFRSARRKNTPATTDWTCKADPVRSLDMDKAIQELRRTRLLVVGGGRGGDPMRQASQKVTGIEFIPIPFETMAAAYDRADRKAARSFAERWMQKAQSIGGVQPEEIEKAGAMCVAMKELMSQHGARGISIHCLAGFYGGHLKAYPCLGFCQLNDDGFVGGCEADQMSAMTMAAISVLTGRPGYISDPVIDTSKNAIVYAHCVAPTKPFGPGGAANPFQILTHSEDRQGASIRSLLPTGYMTTTLEINPITRQVLFHRAKTIANNPSDMACRTKLEAVVQGDLEKLTEHWSMGWHRVTFYGDLEPQVKELCSRLKLQLVSEA